MSFRCGIRHPGRWVSLVWRTAAFEAFSAADLQCLTGLMLVPGSSNTGRINRDLPVEWRLQKSSKGMAQTPWWQLRHLLFFFSLMVTCHMTQSQWQRLQFECHRENWKGGPYPNTYWAQKDWRKATALPTTCLNAHQLKQRSHISGNDTTLMGTLT